MTLAEVILATTPQDVYDRLRTVAEDFFVDPGNGTNCPLWHFFVEEYHMECDDVLVMVETVDISEQGEGTQVFLLPQWMTEYQERIMETDTPTMGECMEVLCAMYGCE